MLHTPIFSLHDISVQLPEIPGFCLRAFEGEPDFPHMVRALLASEQADGVDRAKTVEEIIRNYKHLTKSDLRRDVVLAELNGEVVGYSRVDKWRKDDSGAWLYLHFGFLMPEWRKHGVARALIALSLQALKDEGCTEAALGVDTQNLSGALRLYQSMGFAPVKHNITYRKPFPSP